MPLPLIIGIGAAIAGAAGVGAGISGAVKMKDANDSMKESERRHENNKAKVREMEKSTQSYLDSLGNLEISIVREFTYFIELFEKIRNYPKDLPQIGLEKLEKFDIQKIKKASMNAVALTSALSGVAAGSAGGIAASGITTAAVMTFGTASTGTAISTLSGAAATNATLAALGGGSLAAGGGGMALGSMVLGGATLGVGLLVGGIIFNFTSSSISGQADKVRSQVEEAENEMKRICLRLKDISDAVNDYIYELRELYKIYQREFNGFKEVMYSHQNPLMKIFNNKMDIKQFKSVDYNRFSKEQRLIVHNACILVELIVDMCDVHILTNNNTELNKKPVDKYRNISKTYRTSYRT